MKSREDILKHYKMSPNDFSIYGWSRFKLFCADYIALKTESELLIKDKAELAQTVHKQKVLIKNLEAELKEIYEYKAGDCI